MGIGKFQSILISLLAFILLSSVQNEAFAGDCYKEAEGYCWTKDDWVAHQNYLAEQSKMCDAGDTWNGKTCVFAATTTTTTTPDKCTLYPNDYECLDGNKTGLQGEQGECTEAFNEMKKACDQVNEKVVMAMMVQQLSGASASASGNAKVAAGAQSAGALTSASSTVSIGVECYNKAKTCTDVCEPISKLPRSELEKLKDTKAPSLVGQCGTRKSSILAQMGGNIASVMAALANAAAVLRATSPDGVTTPPYDTTPFNFASTPPLDYGVPPGTSGDTIPLDYAGNPQSTKTASYGSNEGAGGAGGGFGAGGAYPGGAPNGQGGGQAASGFKDPGGGVGSGGGYSVSGVPFGGGGGGGNYGNGRDGKGSDGLDLSKFLPGAENDPAKRGLASVEKALQGQGITGANDLSNFEKVSRMMNRKRTALKP